VKLQANKNGHAELLLDFVDRLPLEDADREIVDRAVDLQRLLARPVSIVTGDGNKQFQAQIAGLEVVRSTNPGSDDWIERQAVRTREGI
jgi:hypothetical protein